MSRDHEVLVRFCPPPAELRKYFTTFYHTRIVTRTGDRLTDLLHPEWGNLRFLASDCVEADNAKGHRLDCTRFAATGPSSVAARFTLGTTRMWGIGILPLGWARFVSAPAASMADALLDGHADPVFAGFSDLADSLFGPEPDEEEELERIGRYFLARLEGPARDEDLIQAIHAALVDPEVASVADMVERVGTGQRTIERVCQRAFGFSPKLLLRRQRFMRSLAQFMLDPSLMWIGAIDSHYHDQAQFVRDFRRFMGMTPRAYAALPKPIIGAIVRARAQFAGAAVQTLDAPTP